MGMLGYLRGSGHVALNLVQSRIVLKVKGDNVAALTLLVKMRPNGPNVATIACELAFRLVEL